jgi:serine/threonine protein kinase
MAPEIFKSKQYGYFTDMWSIGIIFYEMLYGERPFTQCTNIAQLIKKLEKKIKIMPPKFTLNMVSEDCIVLLQSMLDKNMNERATITDVINHVWLCEYKYTHNDVAYSFNTFSHGIMKDNISYRELNNDIHDDIIGGINNNIHNDIISGIDNDICNDIISGINNDISEFQNIIIEHVHKNDARNKSGDDIFNMEI